jgi:hypothetical protein
MPVPLRTKVEQHLVDALDRADVETPGRLDRDEHLRRRIDLAREDQPLQVPAGQDADGRIESRRARSRTPRAVPRLAPRRAVVEQRAARQRRVAEGAQDQVVDHDRFGALPTPARSSGTCATPAAIDSRPARGAPTSVHHGDRPCTVAGR